MFKFETINLTDLIIAVAVSTALLISIFYGTNELSMTIVSGLFGYIGGATKGTVTNIKNKEGVHNE